jgi:transcriptional regulator with PAS, ATPase and Fis domain
MWQLTAKHGKRKGKSWPITGEAFVIGRNPACAITLRDELVSREHCRIDFVDGELVLVDLGSANCTLVNGRPVTRCVLTIGDELATGDITFIVTRSSADESSTGTPKTLHTTQRVLLQPSASGVNADSDGGTLTVRELAQLNILANALAACRNTQDLLKAAAQCVHERFTAAESFISETGNASEILKFPNSSLLDASIVERVTHFAKAEPVNPDVNSHRLPDGTQAITSLNPLRVGDSFIGVFGVHLIIREDEDLDRFVSFANGAAKLIAPFWVAISDRPHGVDTASQISKVESTFLGESEVAEQARKLIAIAANANLPVLIQGETGTGKELAARLIHDLSDRSPHPFVAINCAAIAEDLFESEMFGHTKGAYTGATSDREGLLAEAHGGHLFLDEIVDLSVRNQSRFLRAIETGQFRPVGASRDRVTKFIPIAASNRDLFAAVEASQFRDDLFYRISAIELFLPPLSERKSDIPLLANHFAQEFAQERNFARKVFEDDALDYLVARPWRGNVRELRNCVGKISSFAQSQRVSRSLIENILARPRQNDSDHSRRIEDIERSHIERVLAECGGRISDAAEVLGMHRNTLSKKLKKFKPRK